MINQSSVTTSCDAGWGWISLWLDEKETITRGLVAKRSIQEMADKLSRSPRLLVARYRGSEVKINTVQQKLIRKQIIDRSHRGN